MGKFSVLLPLILTACVSTPASPSAASPKQEGRPTVASDSLRGRWLIEAVNGQPTNDLWLELGGEGSVVMNKRADGGINIGSPQPPTKAFLGCNNLQLTGWTRKNGNKVSLGMEGSTKTERGCNTDTMALEAQAYEILSKAMTMEFQAPSNLRLINEVGTLSLKRAALVR